jgi:hypothetical protein
MEDIQDDLPFSTVKDLPQFIRVARRFPVTHRNTSVSVSYQVHGLRWFFLAILDHLRFCVNHLYFDMLNKLQYVECLPTGQAWDFHCSLSNINDFIYWYIYCLFVVSVWKTNNISGKD